MSLHHLAVMTKPANNYVYVVVMRLPVEYVSFFMITAFLHIMLKYCWKYNLTGILR